MAACKLDVNGDAEAGGAEAGAHVSKLGMDQLAGASVPIRSAGDADRREMW